MNLAGRASRSSAGTEFARLQLHELVYSRPCPPESHHANITWSIARRRVSSTVRTTPTIGGRRQPIRMGSGRPSPLELELVGAPFAERSFSFANVLVLISSQPQTYI